MKYLTDMTHKVRPASARKHHRVDIYLTVRLPVVEADSDTPGTCNHGLQDEIGSHEADPDMTDVFPGHPRPVLAEAAIDTRHRWISRCADCSAP